MKPRFRPILIAICSCIIGLLVGIGAQRIHMKNLEEARNRVTQEFESRGESPPLLIDFLKPSAYPMMFSAGFGVAGTLLYLVYYLVASKSRT